MKKKKKMWLAVLAVLELVVLLLVAAYAWIESINKPKIEGSQMSISTATGLLMRLNGDVTSTIDVNKFIDQKESDPFMLKEASSPDGVTIYVRDGSLERVAANTEGADTKEVRLSQNSNNENVRYIDFSFELLAEGGARDVWLDKNNCKLALSDSAAEGLSSNALRMSLTFEPQAVEGNSEAKIDKKTYVFAPNPEESMKATGDNLPAKEVNPSTGTDAGLIKTRITYKASSTATDGDLYLYPFTYFDKTTPLISLVENQHCDVTLRVWLEGTDPACEDKIAGNYFDLALMFDSTPSATSTETPTT